MRSNEKQPSHHVQTRLAFTILAAIGGVAILSEKSHAQDAPETTTTAVASVDIGMNTPFENLLLEDLTLASDRVLQPSDFTQGHATIEVMTGDNLRARGNFRDILYSGSGFQDLKEAALLLGFSEQQFEETMETQRRFIARGPWVDTYLDYARSGSQGTTLFITDGGGNVIGMMAALHTDLLEGNQSQVLYDTIMEESVQALVYQTFITARQKYPTEFQAMGFTSDLDIVEALTSGNLRGYLEFVQHAAIQASRTGWIYFPYQIHINDSEPTRNISRIRAAYQELEGTFLQESAPQDPNWFLSQFANPDLLVPYLKSLQQPNGFNVWDNFGIIREGMRIFPGQEFLPPRSITFVTPDAEQQSALREQAPTYQALPPSEYPIGTPLYVRSTRYSEVFLQFPQADGSVNVARPTQNYAIPENRVMRVIVTAPGVAKIAPDNGMYNPFGNGHQETFVHLSDFSVIHDLESITLFADTQPQDKQIVVVKGDHPQILLLEGDTIILRTPVILGSSEPTPVGDHHISLSRGSRHMPGQIGVGFANYFGGGMALHSSPWWNWENIDAGFYGSHGCINLPEGDWGSIPTPNGDISVAEFVFRWIRTNLDYDITTTDHVQRSWNDPGFLEGTSSVRLIIINDISDLIHYRKQGSLEDFQPIVDQFSQTQGTWVLPNLK